MSCCLLMAAGKANRVERREHTNKDLQDPDVFVLDQGKQHDFNLSNFDHHQLAADAPPTCTITLVLAVLNINVDYARGIWSWLEFAEIMDSKGPYTMAKRMGTSAADLHAAQSPIATTVLRLFGARSLVTSAIDSMTLTGYQDWLPALMIAIGQENLDLLKKVTGRVELLKEEAKFFEVQGLTVCDITSLPKGQDASLGLDLFLRSVGKGNCAITLSNNERGNGLCLYRRGDDSRINFARLAGRPGVIFTHANGFVCKINAGVDPKLMIEDSIVSN